MAKPPLILVSASTQRRGAEFSDVSLSLSAAYTHALIAGGGLPVVMPMTTERELLAEGVRRCDGVMLTGGDDVNPALYAKRLPSRLRRTVGPLDPLRDLRELLVIEEVFRHRKPLLAICRGHQLLNVALGGTLLVDIEQQNPNARNHRKQKDGRDSFHEAQLTEGSLLAKIAGKLTLGVNSAHHQAVARVAGPLQVTGRGEDGVVESMELKAEARSWLPFLLSVQFHPERMAGRFAEHQAIFRAFAAACVLNRKNTI